MVRIDGQCLLRGGECVVEATLKSAKASGAGVCIGVARIQRQCLPEQLFGALQTIARFGPSRIARKDFIQEDEAEQRQSLQCLRLLLESRLEVPASTLQ